MVLVSARNFSDVEPAAGHQRPDASFAYDHQMDTKNPIATFEARMWVKSHQMMRRFSMAAAVVWGACGVVALLVLAGITTSDFALLVSIMPGYALSGLGPRGILADSAHGPPFLTFAGIVVVYWVPASLMFLWARRRA